MPTFHIFIFKFFWKWALCRTAFSHMYVTVCNVIHIIRVHTNKHHYSTDGAAHTAHTSSVFSSFNMIIIQWRYDFLYNMSSKWNTLDILFDKTCISLYLQKNTVQCKIFRGGGGGWTGVQAGKRTAGCQECISEDARGWSESIFVTAVLSLFYWEDVSKKRWYEYTGSGTVSVVSSIGVAQVGGRFIWTF